MTLRLAATAAQVRATNRNRGLIQVTSVDASPSATERRGPVADTEAPGSVVTVIQRVRRSIVRQPGREVLLRPGDVAVYPSARRFTHTLIDGSVADVFVIPLTSLGMTIGQIEHVSAVNLLDRTPMAALMRDLFQGLVSHRLGLSTRARLAGPLAEILRLTLEAAAVPTSLPPTEGLADRIVTFVLDHLGDPDLGAEMVARAHNISVRQMYAVLARSDVGLSALIRTRRLQRVRAVLADPATAEVPISTLAQQHGSVSASHFSRRFRQEFGMTPRAWRSRCSSLGAED